MSLVFDNAQSVAVSFTVKTLADKNGLDTVLVSKDIWRHFGQPGNDRVALSIRPVQPQFSIRRKRQSLKALTCWAVLDENVASLSIPPMWLETFRHIFPHSAHHQIPLQITHTLSRTIPVLLTEVIVTALSSEAYQVASSRGLPLETRLSSDSIILRQGTIYTFDSEILPTNGRVTTESRRTYCYRLDMMEPVLQGYARIEHTRFYLVLVDQANVHLSLEDEQGLESGGQSGSNPDGIEIDESFLGSSVLHSRQSPPSNGNDAICLSINDHQYPNDRLEASTCHSNSQLRVELTPELPFMPRDDYTLCLRTFDLGKIGVLDGDWAIAEVIGASNSRLVRISVRDDLVNMTGKVIGSPVLLHNIFSSSNGIPEDHILLRASPYGSRQPAIPTARTVTVARVASPISTNRTYQPLFLRSLKNYFGVQKRLIKKGDLIAIGVDTDSVCHVVEIDPDSDEVGDLDITDGNYSFPSVHVNEVVFFVITNIEHDMCLVDEDSSSQNTCVGLTTGKLGFWMDSATTRMVQTGLEHSRIPDVATYIGADDSSPNALLSKLSKKKSSHILRQESSFGKLLALTSATMMRHAVDYELHLSVLLKGVRGIGKFTVATWVAQRLGMHLLEINCYDVICENDVKTEGTLRSRFEKANSCSPCILMLRHIDALAQTTQSLEGGKVVENVLRECLASLQNLWRLTGFPVLVFGTASDSNRVPPGVLSCFKHEVAFEAPNELERHEILDALLADSILAADVSLSTLATQTAALVASDLVDLVERTHLISIERAMSATFPSQNKEQENFRQAGICLTAADFEASLGQARASYSQSIGAPNIPNVSWDDVGGLAHVKSDILDTIQLPLDHPELFADGLKKRSGILLYGPPGTGKTLLAKAVATSCSLNFFSVKGPELLNMYIGESEANVRRVFQRARDAKPCVIFFDELDSIAPKRGNHGDSGGVMDRIVSQLLAELDGMSSGKGGADIFVIGATNRPDLLDPALLRPGRFDRMLYLGVSETHGAQLDILRALTRKFRLDRGLELRHIAEQCPFNYTGADLYALCSDAMLNAMSRKAEALETKLAVLNKQPAQHSYPHPLTPQYYLAELASPEDTDILVSQRDFDQAFCNLVPSVSRSEMDHYAEIQRTFSRKAYIDTNGNSSGSRTVADIKLGNSKGKGRAIG